MKNKELDLAINMTASEFAEKYLNLKLNEFDKFILDNSDKYEMVILKGRGQSKIKLIKKD